MAAISAPIPMRRSVFSSSAILRWAGCNRAVGADGVRCCASASIPTVLQTFPAVGATLVVARSHGAPLTGVSSPAGNGRPQGSPLHHRGPTFRLAEASGCPAAYSGINANVHSEPPDGTLSATKRGATAPPNPDAID